MTASSLEALLAPSQWVGPALGLAAAWFLVAAARRGWPRPLTGLVLLAPVAASALFAREFNRVGWHTLMHFAQTCATLRLLPPEDPLLAGEPLRYPWVFDWLTGLALRALDLPLAQTLALLDVLLAGALLVVLDRLAARFSPARLARDVALLLGFWGVAWGLGWLPGFAFHGLHLGVLDHRPFPLDKFANTNANQVGYALFVAGSLALVSFLESPGRGLRWLGGWAGAVLAASFLYPLSWGALGLALGLGGGAVLLVRPTRAVAMRLALAGGAALVASLPSVPLARALSAGRAPEGGVHLATSGDGLGNHVATLLMFGGVLLLVLVRRRAALRGAASPLGVAWAVGTAAGFAALYLVVRGPTDVEYKLLLHACLPVALLAGAATGGSAPTVPMRPVALVALLALPAAGALQTMAFRFTIVPSVAVESHGFSIHAADPEAEPLFEYLRGHTAPDAVVVTLDGTTSALGQRSLYVAFDRKRETRFDGFGQAMTSLLAQLGHAPALLAHRRALATALLARDAAREPGAVARELRAELGGRPLYVLHGDGAVVARLVGSGDFRVVASTRWASLLEAAPATAGAAPTPPAPGGPRSAPSPAP